MVLGILQESAPVREVLLDGQRRDEALDTYERLLLSAAGGSPSGSGSASPRRVRPGLAARSEDLQAALGAWKKRKNEEEDLMELRGT